MAEWTLKLGAMHDGKLAELLVQEAGFGNTEAEQFQADAHAVTRLNVRQYVGDTKVEAMRADLVRRIRRHMKKLEEKANGRQGQVG